MLTSLITKYEFGGWLLRQKKTCLRTTKSDKESTLNDIINHEICTIYAT